MNEPRLFKASSYILIGSGFAAVMAAGAVGPVPIVLFAAVFIISWRSNTSRLQRMVSVRTANLLASGYAAFFAVDYLLLSRPLITALLHVLLFAVGMKLLTLTKDREYVQLYIVSFALLLTASVLTVTIAFLFCLLIFLISGIATLFLFDLRRNNARIRKKAVVRPSVPAAASETGMELPASFPAGIIASATMGLAALVIASSIPLFFLLPRPPHVMNPQPAGETRFVSGFSDSIRLGRIGTISQSDTIVMRVRTDRHPEKLSDSPRWRGIAFDHFDGHSWERSDTTLHGIPLQGRFYKLEDEALGTNWIQQTFFIEALSTNVVFAMARPLAVSREVGLLQRDAAENVYTSRHDRKKLSYTAISDPVTPDPALIADYPAIPRDIHETYLQLPHLDPRIEALAGEITQQVSGSYAKAVEIERYLRSYYGYSLDLEGIPGSEDPLAVFLFDTRSGHCEYFASAMAIMLRQTGIPARLVNGFRAGTYNRIGRNWTVRQHDAHSWVEAYLPPYGWIAFDPTPPELYPHRTALETMRSDLSDLFTLWWWDGIVNYDAARQYRMISSLHDRRKATGEAITSLLASAREKSRGISSSITSRLQHSGKSAVALYLFILAVPAVIFMIRPLRMNIMRAVKRFFSRRTRLAVAAGFYEEALELLAARGYRRGIDQTPLEFVESLALHPSAGPLLSITRIYNSARFGRPGSGVSLPETRAHLEALRNTLNGKP